MVAAAGDWTRKGTLTAPVHTNPPSDICDRAGSSTLSARTHAPYRAGFMCPAAECALIPAGRCGRRPLRKDRRVHPHIRRRGRRPAVERSGTNALGVRRPVSAAVPRCEAPSGRGAVGAADWGRENRVESLPPPALRAATSLAEGGKGDPYPLARRDTWVPPYGLRYARPCRFFDRLKCPPRMGRAFRLSKKPVIASQCAPRSKCPWGTDWRGNPFLKRMIPALFRRFPAKRLRIPAPVTSVTGSE